MAWYLLLANVSQSILGVDFLILFGFLLDPFNNALAIPSSSKGLSHDIYWALVYMKCRSRTRKLQGVVLKFCCTALAFIFKEITWACFLLAEGFTNVSQGIPALAFLQ